METPSGTEKRLTYNEYLEKFSKRNEADSKTNDDPHEVAKEFASQTIAIFVKALGVKALGAS